MSNNVCAVEIRMSYNVVQEKYKTVCVILRWKAVCNSILKIKYALHNSQASVSDMYCQELLKLVTLRYKELIVKGV